MMYILKILTGEKDELYTIITKDIVEFRSQPWIDANKCEIISIIIKYNFDYSRYSLMNNYFWKIEYL